MTTPERITVHGGSAGGLLAGEMLTLHPELIGAAVAEVPLMDMGRDTHLLAGAFWRTEFGEPDNPADWALMEALHNRGCRWGLNPPVSSRLRAM
ncbi:prolyl oligopeptidase family serine peptidase [Actinomyces haliotis]|uniref:prolyl oligopeptidase family serine peptidase n=1 Tax=Actinomyces haliotis TaxID=1280843 RepID=UPI002B26940A|nr:prolyl oligopeptidase family serine peptidase [Actinomyces haliotis]